MPVILTILGLATIIFATTFASSEVDKEKGNPDGTHLRVIILDLLGAFGEILSSPLVKGLLVATLLLVITVLTVLAAIYSALTG